MNYKDSVTNIALEKAKARLIQREGRVGKVYKDSRGFLTGGIGHLIRPSDGLKFGDFISEDLIDEWFENDVRYSLDAALRQCNELNLISAEFLAALISVNFQLGPKWNLPTKNGGKGFTRTWQLIKEKRYTEAIQNLRKSAWFKQTPKRVEDFIQSLEYLKQLFYH